MQSGQGMRVALGTASPKRPGAEAVAVLEGMPDGGEAVRALHAMRAKADGRQLEPIAGGADGKRHGSPILIGVRPAVEAGVASEHGKCSQ